MFCFFGHKVYGILVRWPSIESVPSAQEGKVSTTEPLGKSLFLILIRDSFFFSFLLMNLVKFCLPLFIFPKNQLDWIKSLIFPHHLSHFHFMYFCSDFYYALSFTDFWFFVPLFLLPLDVKFDCLDLSCFLR